MKNGNIGNLLRANKRLSRELARMEAFFNVVNSAIVIVDERGQTSFSNAFARDFFAMRDSAPFSIYKILPGLEEKVRETLSSLRPSVCEMDMTYPEKRSLRVQIVPLDFESEGAEIVALVFTDITEEKLSTEERIESGKIASVVNLAAGVAHELGNPLNSINIHLQLAMRRLKNLSGLSDSSKVAEISESLKICSEEVSRLDAIIENFLKALKPMKPDLRECDPIKPLVETLNTLKIELHNLKISVDVSSDSHLPSVLGDESLLKQLYFNVLKNAMEAMDSGGEISIKATSDDEFVRVSFSDTGCGILPEDLAKLFRPYFTTKPGGHGLGMMIIDGIVRAHGGKIDVESKRGKGTKISIAIPRKSPNVKMLDS